MKIAVFAIALSWSALAACAAAPMPEPATSALRSSQGSTGVLRVNVHGLEPRHGKVVVAVYDRAADFPKAHREIYLGRADVTSDSVVVIIDGVASGTYACAVIDDVDGNGTLNTNLVGYPTEPFGFSNHAPVKLFGPPDFDDAKFEFREPETSIDVTLR